VNKHSNIVEKIDEYLSNKKVQEIEGSDVDLDAILAELSIYHAELESQNQELREQFEINATLNKLNHSLYENAPNPYLLLDQKFKVVKSNKKAIELFRDIDSDTSVFNLVPTKSKRDFMSWFSKVPQTQSIDIVMKTFDGEKWQRLSVEYFEDLFMITCIDIDADIKRKRELQDAKAKAEQAEHQVALLNKSLEKKVKDQVEQIKEQEALIMSQQHLSQMGEMISMIAHQWRQPLSVIASVVSVINIENELADVTNKKLSERLTTVADTTRMLSSIIDDFRDFYASSSNLQMCDIHVVIDKAVAIVKHMYKERYKIEIIHQHTNKKCFCEIIESQMMQVIMNLLSNAKDACIDTDTTDPKITIITECTEEYVTITLKDNGGGIAKDSLSKIFDPYFSTKGLNGTGIGLYMVHSTITKNHSGSITASNNEDGAEFVIELPKRRNNSNQILNKDLS